MYNPYFSPEVPLKQRVIKYLLDEKNENNQPLYIISMDVEELKEDFNKLNEDKRYLTREDAIQFLVGKGHLLPIDEDDDFNSQEAEDQHELIVEQEEFLNELSQQQV
jgi:hypothetical protein